MSPIYRAETVRFSFAGEPGLGGYLDTISASTAGTASTTLSSVAVAGSRSLSIVGVSTFAVGDYILIGAVADAEAEIRRIVGITSVAPLALYLDYPTGFYHASGAAVANRTSAAMTGNSFITFLPGVYRTIETPDLEPDLQPQYYLATGVTRNWSYLYRGQQRFTGRVSNVILLNGYPLRFGVGSVRTRANSTAGYGAGNALIAASTLSAIANKGVRTITVALISTYANGNYIAINDAAATDTEIRQIISGGGTTTLVLNYPVMFTFASGLTVARVDTAAAGLRYEHTIIETSVLDSLSWNVRLRDSDGTAANDFTRRYTGGKVNRASITAEEGGLLSISWDEVIFQDLVHNQLLHSSIGGAFPVNQTAKSSQALVDPSTNPGGIGGDIPQLGGALGIPVYPTTQPYYFSQGSISIFGVIFARIRDFRLEITNNIDPRYYLRETGAIFRGPSELQEQLREYRFSATIAMEDSIAALTSTTRSLWKELILEGNYAAFGSSSIQGFNIELIFTRGTNDTIRIRSPIDQTPSTAFEDQGCFFLRGKNSVGEESPLQVDGEIILRNLEIIVTDAIPVYP